MPALFEVSSASKADLKKQKSYKCPAPKRRHRGALRGSGQALTDNKNARMRLHGGPRDSQEEVVQPGLGAHTTPPPREGERAGIPQHPETVQHALTQHTRTSSLDRAKLARLENRRHGTSGAGPQLDVPTE